MRRDVFWIPALLVGSALYWTVAMRLGSMSVGILGSSSEDLELVPAVTTIDVDIVDDTEVSGLGRIVRAVEEPEESFEAEEEVGEPIVVRLQPWVEGTGAVESGTGGVGGDDVPRGSRPPPVEDSIGRTAF